MNGRVEPGQAAQEEFGLRFLGQLVTPNPALDLTTTLSAMNGRVEPGQATQEEFGLRVLGQLVTPNPALDLTTTLSAMNGRVEPGQATQEEFGLRVLGQLVTPNPALDLTTTLSAMNGRVEPGQATQEEFGLRVLGQLVHLKIVCLIRAPPQPRCIAVRTNRCSWKENEITLKCLLNTEVRPSYQRIFTTGPLSPCGPCLTKSDRCYEGQRESAQAGECRSAGATLSTSDSVLVLSLGSFV
ncbi:hypothetical protein RRG08_013531 [Elysia crispata]|uniref:Uncharacterized protein n=1 Tax=Elysia crispata TaxID=231223 RepID=A0AAE0Y1Q4_9GAST|nr:hypothetical protein RRG08_013531 [Elysia crispata]